MSNKKNARVTKKDIKNREILLEELKKCSKNICDCKRANAIELMFDFYMERADILTKLGDLFYAFMDYQIAFNLHIRDNKSADDVMRLYQNALLILIEINWGEEFYYWLNEAKKTFESIKPNTEEYKIRLEYWKDEISHIEKLGKTKIKSSKHSNLDKEVDKYITDIKDGLKKDGWKDCIESEKSKDSKLAMEFVEYVVKHSGKTKEGDFKGDGYPKMFKYVKEDLDDKTKQKFWNGYVNQMKFNNENIKKQISIYFLKDNYRGEITSRGYNNLPYPDELGMYESEKTKIFLSKFDRGTKSKIDIKKGEVIFEETPFLAYYSSREGDRKCSRCGMKLNTDFKTCKSCKEPFCSHECHKAAWKEYHKFECNLLGKHLESIREKVQANVTPTLLAAPMFLRFIGKIVQDEKSGYPLNPFKIEPFNHLFVGDYSRYSVYDSGKHILNEYKVSGKYLFQNYVNFIVFLSYGKKDNELWKSSTYPYFDFETFMKFSSMVVKNMVVRDSNDLVLFKKMSFLNHSCEPNAGIIDGGIKIKNGGGLKKLIALKDIKRGEEIKVSYVNPKLGYMLRTKLLERYEFMCKCGKCKKEVKSSFFHINKK